MKKDNQDTSYSPANIREIQIKEHVSDEEVAEKLEISVSEYQSWIKDGISEGKTNKIINAISAISNSRKDKKMIQNAIARLRGNTND